MTNGVHYSPELAEHISEVLATGTRSIATLCKEETGFPSYRIFFTWLRKYPEFMRLYRIAKMQQVEPLVDSMFEIIHAAKTNAEIRRARLEVDTIKWQAGKLSQRLYGEKVMLSDPEGGPVKFVLERMGEFQSTPLRETSSITLKERQDNA
jgi:hypothetical protein